MPPKMRPGHDPGKPAPLPEERIRAELSSFVPELGRMPRRRDFQAAGRTALYIAASKAGGMRRWAAELATESQ